MPNLPKDHILKVFFDKKIENFEKISKWKECTNFETLLTFTQTGCEKGLTISAYTFKANYTVYCI